MASACAILVRTKLAEMEWNDTKSNKFTRGYLSLFFACVHVYCSCEPKNAMTIPLRPAHHWSGRGHKRWPWQFATPRKRRRDLGLIIGVYYVNYVHWFSSQITSLFGGNRGNRGNPWFLIQALSIQAWHRKTPLEGDCMAPTENLKPRGSRDVWMSKGGMGQ